MLSKISVNKYQNGSENKSLRISIQDDEGMPAIYGAWSNGHISPKRTKTSRVVVQVLIGGVESKYLDLDGCAQQFKNVEKINNTHDNYDLCNAQVNNFDFTSKLAPNDNMDFTSNNATCDSTPCSLNTFADYFKNENDRNSGKNDEFVLKTNPLDYYIKKVNENNKQIVRSIQTLSAALDYCKKKEMVQNLNKSMENFSCGDYDKSFVYEPYPRRHVTRQDSEPAMWLTVWACSACHQVWPRRDVVGQHMERCPLASEKDVVCEHNTSTLLQCEFCEKVFRCLSGLVSHVDTHTTAKNYQCEPCEVVFASYKTIELHWQRCFWLHRYYYFNLTKMRPCNICDVKFPTYDQLYNHRYSVGHFTMKHHQGMQGEGLDTLVYQCEQCGQLFVSDSYLLVHQQSSHGASTNNQYHDGLPQFLQAPPQLCNDVC